MKHVKNSRYFFVLISGLFLVSCNDSASTSAEKDRHATSAVTNKEITSMPAYDPAMEPVTVAAEFSKMLSDT